MTSPETRALVTRLADLLRSERSTLVVFLLTLADFDDARGWEQLGYASLFDFLHRELRLAKGTAFYRKTAVQLVQQFPEVVEPLRDGRLCISSVAELAKVLTRENLAETLPRFFHCSRQEAKAVTAELLPAEVVPVRTTVTVIHAATPAPSSLLLVVGGVERREPAPAVSSHGEPALPDRGTPAVTVPAPASTTAPTPRDQSTRSPPS